VHGHTLIQSPRSRNATHTPLSLQSSQVLPTNHSSTSHPLFFLKKAYWFLASGRREFDNYIQEGHFANSLDGESCVASGLVAACGRVGSFARGSVLTQKLRKEYLTTQVGDQMKSPSHQRLALCLRYLIRQVAC